MLSNYFVGEEANPEDTDCEATDKGEETNGTIILPNLCWLEWIEDDEREPYKGERGGKAEFCRLTTGLIENVVKGKYKNTDDRNYKNKACCDATIPYPIYNERRFDKYEAADIDKCENDAANDFAYF